MLTVLTPLTLILAKAMGLYMIAAGLSGLIAPARWKNLLDGFKTNDALTYVSGVFVFALGVAIIMAHNIWTDPLSIIVSVFGWAATVEGLILIAYPAPLLNFSATLLRPGAVRAFAAFSILLGAFLLIGGLIGTARA